MSDPALPQIKVVDTQNPDGSAGGTPGLESPSTTDGGQSQRPKSATSSEGQSALCLYYAVPQWPGTSTWDVQMSCLLVWLLASALLLTRVFTTGNTQAVGKKSQIALIRNSSSRDINGGKPISATPPAAGRAIDPLSIVRTPHLNTRNAEIK
jgi:hypothetical protein